MHHFSGLTFLHVDLHFYPPGKIDGGTDGLPYTTIGYLNGPGGSITSQSFAANGRRPNLTDTETSKKPSTLYFDFVMHSAGRRS